MNRLRLSLAAVLAVLAALAGPAAAAPMEVVASFTVLADMAREIGGARVHVRSLIGPDGDPHAFEPSPQDARALSGARLVLVSGLGLEGWMARLVKASGYRGEVVVASDGVATRRMEEGGRPMTDPHAWNSAANGAIYARNVADGMARADPAGAEAYRAAAAAYEARLRALDAWAREAVGGIPPAKRKVITSHEAFGYLGAAYGIEFLAPARFSTDAEPSAADVAALIDQIRRERIGAVFLERSNDPRMVEQIARATGARVGGTLYPEALSGPDGPAPTYERMFRHNVEMLVAGMRANRAGSEPAPPRRH